jgi:hypothetical protein
MIKDKGLSDVQTEDFRTLRQRNKRQRTKDLLLCPRSLSERLSFERPNVLHPNI